MGKIEFQLVKEWMQTALRLVAYKQNP